MNISEFPLLTASISPRRQHNLELAIQNLVAGKAAGEILNARFNEVKADVSRAFEEGWREYNSVNPYRDSMPEAVKDFYYRIYAPMAHRVAPELKRLRTMPECPQRDTAIAFFAEIEPLANLVVEMKGKVVKRQTKSEEERKIERYTPPPSSSKAVAQVRTMLERVVDAQYDNLVNLFETQYTAGVLGFLKAQQEAKGDITKNEPRYRGGYDSTYTLRWHFRHDPSMLIVAQKVAKYVGNHEVTIAGNYRDTLRQLAVEDATHVRNTFVAKNLRKMVAILEAKENEFVSCEEIGNSISLSGLQGSLKLTFSDGASFEVNNSLVWSRSTLGKLFYRCPLTFHNVTLPGGAKMKQPSEKRMNTVFLGK